MPNNIHKNKKEQQNKVKYTEMQQVEFIEITEFNRIFNTLEKVFRDFINQNPRIAC